MLRYPIFIESSQYTDDEYWRTIIQELAYGNAPHGFYIDREQESICSSKSKDKLFFGEETNAQTLFNNTVAFMKELGLCSHLEYIQRHKNLQEAYSPSLNWMDIKKKHIRDALLCNYVIEIKHRLDLTTQQMKIFMSNLALWFQFKLLNKEDVEYDYHKQRIVKIRDVEILDNGVVCLKRNIVE